MSDGTVPATGGEVHINKSVTRWTEPCVGLLKCQLLLLVGGREGGTDGEGWGKDKSPVTGGKHIPLKTGEGFLGKDRGLSTHMTSAPRKPH